MPSFIDYVRGFGIAGMTMLALAASVVAPAGAHADMLTIGLSSDVTSIDPQWNNSGPNVSLSTHIFEPLTLTDRNGRLIPGLATSWRAIDPLTWEFKLRPGVKFHDGSALTADIDANALKVTLPSPMGPAFSEVDTISATSDQQALSRLDQP